MTDSSVATGSASGWQYWRRPPLRRGAKLLHLCFEVSNLDDALDTCRPHRFHRLRPPVPTDAFHGRRVVWVYSKALGLFELLER